MPVHAEFQAYLHVSTYNPNSRPPPAPYRTDSPATSIRIIPPRACFGDFKGFEACMGVPANSAGEEREGFKTWPPDYIVFCNFRLKALFLKRLEEAIRLFPADSEPSNNPREF